MKCTNCEVEFDPYREHPTPGKDTSRCPSCGKSHDVPEREPTPATDGGQPDGSATVRIVIEIETDGANVNVEGS